MGKNSEMRGPHPSDIHDAYLRILYWFFAVPNKDFTFNEICRHTKTAKTTAQLAVEELLIRGLISKTVLGRLWRLKAKEESPLFRGLKSAFNLAVLYESNILDKINARHPRTQAIVLFGSYRKGDDVPGSDIDIAVEVRGLKQMVIEEIERLTTIGWRTNVPVKVHLFSRDTVDINVFSNIANGIVLDGFLEVYPTCE
ncbi:MAG TPA: nucleotidyltransferase domain-containing protein [Candidatus Nanoarchaeia archaeon]|nr:nucleotidyltransferase domain-containing protein [Candidatus Nanoarchaeia archaeon]